MTTFFDNNGDPQMDPYAVLHIQCNASDTDIKKAYRTQMLKLHPDKLPPNLSAEEINSMTDKFHIVKEAYQFLTNAQYLTARRLYMAKLASRRADYERREAYLRRHQNSMNRSSASDPIPARVNSNIHRQRNSNRYGNQNPSTSRSYAIPPRRKSEPNLKERQGGRNDARGQSTGGRRQENKVGGANQTRKYRGGTDGNAPRGRARPGATNNTNHISSGRAKRSKSSTAARKNESPHHRGRSQPQSSRSKSSRRDQTQKEGGVGGSQGSNKENHKNSSSSSEQNQKKRGRQMSRDGAKKVRSRSAPARYYSKNKAEKSFGTRRAANRGDLPDGFFCPLTKRLMKDPVVDDEGNNYERKAIELWLRAHNTSPVTNELLTLEMLQPNKKLKKQIYKATGKPRSRSQTPRARSTSPGSNNSDKEKNANRQLVDSYLREISANSKLSVSLDFMGICAFSYRKITFVIEVPLEPKTGFYVYSSFRGDASTCQVSEKLDAWNNWLSNVGKLSRVSCVKAGKKSILTMNGNQRDIRRRETFQKTLEYFVEMSLKLHNILHPKEIKVVENVCLTRTPVAVS